MPDAVTSYIPLIQVHVSVSPGGVIFTVTVVPERQLPVSVGVESCVGVMIFTVGASMKPSVPAPAVSQIPSFGFVSSSQVYPDSIAQIALHPSPSVAFPSSQDSPDSIIAFPHRGTGVAQLVHSSCMSCIEYAASCTPSLSSNPIHTTRSFARCGVGNKSVKVNTCFSSFLSSTLRYSKLGFTATSPPRDDVTGV